MKTSNKLLSSAACGIIIGMAVFMLSAKSHITFIEQQKIEGNRNVIEEVRNVSIPNNTLKLNHHFIYMLDPSRRDVVIRAESNIIPFIQTETADGSLEITRNRNQTYEVKEPIQLTIGIKDYDYLAIEVDEHARVMTADPLIMQSLSLKCSESAAIELDIQCQDLTVTLENRVQVSLTGEADKLTLVSEDNAVFGGEDLRVNSAIVELSNNSTSNVNIAKKLSGVVDDRAEIRYNKDVGLMEIEQKESGKAVSK